MKIVPALAEASSPVTPSATDWQDAARQHHRRVLATVLAMGVRADRAEEVVQATWSTLIEAEGAGRLARVELPGLALTQARFLALHELRRGGVERRLLLPSDDLAARVGRPLGGPEAALLAKEDAQRALRTIETMPESAQRVFRLLYGEPRLPYAEAAARLGLSLQRVRQIVCELRAGVRAVLDEERP